MLHYIKGIQRKFGFSIIGGTLRDDISTQLAFRNFSAMLDLYMGGCQAAPGDFFKSFFNDDILAPILDQPRECSLSQYAKFQSRVFAYFAN